MKAIFGKSKLKNWDKSGMQAVVRRWMRANALCKILRLDTPTFEF